MRLPLAVRRVLDPVTERIPVPIVGGPNAGRWWTLASAGSGYVTGTRAAHQMRVLGALMREGDVAWDVGAHHGYVTLMAARRVGAAGSVHAFEPSNANRRILDRHVRMNRCQNVVVHSCALGAKDGEASFGGGTTSKMHALGQGDEIVRVRRAEGYAAEQKCRAPTFLKVDVEGAEADFLDGVGALLPSNARLAIAIHHSEAHDRCGAWLTAHGFTVMPSRELTAMNRDKWRGDPDLFAVGPQGGADDVRRALGTLGVVDA